MMRVAMLHWAFPPVIGGVEAHLATLAPRLRARGAEVSLLTGSIDGHHQRCLWSGVPVARTPWMDLNRLRDKDLAACGPGAAREIAAFLSETRPDVVHAHNMHYFSPVHLEALTAWCAAARVPLVLTAHNVWSDELWQRMCTRAAAWDRVIAVSDWVARELVRCGYAAERIVVIHHGLDEERFRPAPSARRARARRHLGLDRRPIVVHPARASVAKGSLVAVEALARIRQVFPDVLLVCAGAGTIVDWVRVQDSELQMIHAAARRHELERNVLVRSFAWEEMPQLYHAADLVIYPSIFDEPFGLGPLEAMASGVAVVVSRSGGMPEFVPHGQAGLVVAPGDAGALAEACIQLLAHPRAAAAMGRRAREQVLSRHTAALMAERTWAVYESALAAGKAA